MESTAVSSPAQVRDHGSIHRSLSQHLGPEPVAAFIASHSADPHGPFLLPVLPPHPSSSLQPHPISARKPRPVGAFSSGIQSFLVPLCVNCPLPPALPSLSQLKTTDSPLLLREASLPPEAEAPKAPITGVKCKTNSDLVRRDFHWGRLFIARGEEVYCHRENKATAIRSASISRVRKRLFLHGEQ